MDILNTGKSVAEREDEGTTFHVRNEQGEKMWADEAETKPVTITVAGTYSNRYRKLTDASNDKAWKKAGRLEAEDNRKSALEIIAGCILKWDGFTAGSAAFPLNKTNAVVLLDQCPWIREQVEKHMTDHALFTAAASLS